jgi:hypothetical protein
VDYDLQKIWIEQKMAAQPGNSKGMDVGIRRYLKVVLRDGWRSGFEIHLL